MPIGPCEKIATLPPIGMFAEPQALESPALSRRPVVSHRATQIHLDQQSWPATESAFLRKRRLGGDGFEFISRPIDGTTISISRIRDRSTDGSQF